MAEGQRFYNQDEVEGILRLAAQSQGASDVNREQLLQMAGEIGLSPEQVAAAERQYALQREMEEEKRRGAALRAQFRTAYRRATLLKAMKTLGVFAVLAVFLGRGDPQVPALFAAIGLILFVKRMSPLFLPDRFEEKFQKWKSGQSLESDRPWHSSAPEFGSPRF